MNIAILGTRGIPNNYGGFEQFAQFISVGLVERGHQVTVYAPHFHPYSGLEFQGVKIRKIFSPEHVLGSMANFIYDHQCLKDALLHEFDIIYEAGYATVALSYKLLHVSDSHSLIVTNMDGIEWKRSKWNFFTKRLIHYLEKLCVAYSSYLISDNEEIQTFYLTEYNKQTKFLAYGAEVITLFDEDCLIEYEVQVNSYFILVARLEPENNIELILNGYLLSHSSLEFVVVGNANTKYGKFLKEKYKGTEIRFLGGVYDKHVLDSLRHFSAIYFHGHSVGGTNPSLLEAMAAGCMVAAHANNFNLTVLLDTGVYFSSVEDIILIIAAENSSKSKYKSLATERIKSIYNWGLIIDQYENYFQNILSSK